jgi:hypothetical protein
MKKLLYLSALLLATYVINAQVPFKVITVNGEIVAVKANVTLENGLEVYSDDNFDFRKPNSRAAMINSERGRIVLTEQNAAEAFSKAAFAPAISSISARGSAFSVADLQGIFEDKVLIIEKMEVKVGSDIFPMMDQNFFFIRYKYNDETINKKLPFRTDTLIIDKNELFTIDGKSIESPDIKEFNIYYYSKNDDKTESLLINTFEPIFVTSDQIKPEIDIIIDELYGKPFETVLAEVYDYLNSFYGKIDKDCLSAWLKKQYKFEE